MTHKHSVSYVINFVSEMMTRTKKNRGERYRKIK